MKSCEFGMNCHDGAIFGKTISCRLSSFTRQRQVQRCSADCAILPTLALHKKALSLFLPVQRHTKTAKLVLFPMAFLRQASRSPTMEKSSSDTSWNMWKSVSECIHQLRQGRFLAHLTGPRERSPHQAAPRLWTSEPGSYSGTLVGLWEKLQKATPCRRGFAIHPAFAPEIHPIHTMSNPIHILPFPP